MWFFIAVIGIVVAYVSGRKWGIQLYSYYRPRLHYILPYIRRKVRPMVGNTLPNITTAVDDIDAKKKFDLESVIPIWPSHPFNSSSFFIRLILFGFFPLLLVSTRFTRREWICVVCFCVYKSGRGKWFNNIIILEHATITISNFKSSQFHKRNVEHWNRTVKNGITWKFQFLNRSFVLKKRKFCFLFFFWMYKNKLEYRSPN